MKPHAAAIIISFLIAPAAIAESRYSASLLLQDSPATEEATTSSPVYGQPDEHWWWTVGGGGGTTFTDDEYNAAAFIGASTFLAEDFEFSLDLTLWYLQANDPRGDDVAGFNLNPKFRWHFIHEETHTVFAELGVGLLITSGEFPTDGSEAHFAPQAGMGMTWPINDGPDRLIAGINWRHFSNANSFGSDRNPGHDELFAYIGVTFPF